MVARQQFLRCRDINIIAKSFRHLDNTAGRDPAVFEDPDRFDLRRRGTAHFGFGGGTHVCLGAALARSELQIMFGSLITRFDRIELGAGPLAYRDSLVLRGLESLPLRLERPAKQRSQIGGGAP